jgi:GNAT superfamily N-acetyltransferase
VPYVDSAAFRAADVVPISRQRALSQARNPRAQADDMVLLLAQRQGVLLGYLGVLPDAAKVDGQTYRFGWLSCLWVDPALRGSGIAKQLLEEVCRFWGGRLMATEFTPPAQRLYETSGHFSPPQEILGLRAYLRPNLAGLLAPKHRLFSRTRFFWKLLDKLLALPNNLRLSLVASRFAPTFEYQQALDEETLSFVRARQSDEWAARYGPEWAWVTGNPWLYAAPGPDDFARRYFFSSVACDFRFFSIKILGPDRKVAGYLLLSLRDGHLRVPYAYFDEDNAHLVARVLAWHCVRLPVTHLTVYRPALQALTEKMSGLFFGKKKIKRSFLSGRALPVLPEPMSFQDGIGDTVFT